MDLMNRLAGLTHLSPDEDLQLHKIPPRHIRDWVTHLSETKTEVKNLEFLFILHESDQLQITTYIHFCHDLSSITDLINRYLTSSNEQEVRVACDVLNVLMCVQDSVVVYNKCCTMLCEIIKFISSCLIDNSKTLPTLITHLTVSKYRIPYILLQFLEDIVEQALSDPESTDVSEQELMSEQETLSESTHAQKRLYEAIRAQKCKFVKLRECSLYLFLIEVFKVLSSTDRYTLIESFFTEKNTNWTAYLVLISAYVNSAESNSAQIQDFIDQNFKSALSKQDIDLTIKCLLLIRQCCLENIKPQYGSYPHWFSNLPIRSKQEFEFFFRVLSQLVPYEDAMYLKIHINKAPSMPLNCQATFSEYSQLAKTQLKDMNETVEYLGLFGTTDYEDRLEDVRKVLHHFHSTNEIADIVLKACVFRRDYYNEIFLRDLLNLRDPSLTPVQIKFVDRLHSAGKVPHQMYANWELKP